MRNRWIAGLFVLLLAACGAQDAENTAAPTVLFGIDGGEWQVIDQMIAEGELPHFAQIKQEGAWGHLINNGMTVSPVVWTTFVTGQFARQHGVLDHVFPFGGSGSRRPVTSELRRVPALWNVATHYGLRSIVVGYFVSHPPEPIDGIIVSSQAPTREPGSIYPTDALNLEDDRYKGLDKPQANAEIWGPFFGWDYDPAQADDPDSPYQQAAATVVERHLENRVLRDEFMRRAMVDLLDEPSDLFIAYYRLPDFMSHSLWKYFEPEVFDDAPSEEAMGFFGESVKESYRFVDQALGEVMDAWGGKANIIIVSDHGFRRATEEKMENPKSGIDYLSGDHRPNGILLATGPDIQPGEIEGITIMEIAPTLAALMGLPIAGDLPGNIAVDLLRPDAFKDRPLQSVSDYSHVPMPHLGMKPNEAVQEEEMEALRGLGYVGEGVTFDSESAAGEYDFWTTDADLLSGHIGGEIIYYLSQGDTDLAEEAYAEILEHRPDAAARTIRFSQAHFKRLMEGLPEGALDPAPFEAFFEAHSR